MKYALLVAVIALALFAYPIHAAWLNTNTYCSNVTVTVESFSWTEHENVIVTNIDLSSLTPRPYNESIRISTQPCNKGGSELPSALIPITQNSTGHVSYGRLIIKQNGTVSSNTTYGLYYNYTVSPVAVYPTDLKVKYVNGNVSIEGNKFNSTFLNGAIQHDNSPENSVNWIYNDGLGGFMWDGLVYNHLGNIGLTTDPTSASHCQLDYNFSVAVQINCTSGKNANSMLHIYYADSYFKQLYPNVVTPSFTGIVSYQLVNGSRLGLNVFYYNTTRNDNYGTQYFNLTRGIGCVFSGNSKYATCYIWNTSTNEVHTELSAGYANINAGSRLRGVESLNGVYITRLWIGGIINQSMTDNFTNYWRGLIEKPVLFNAGASMQIPVSPATPSAPPVSQSNLILQLFPVILGIGLLIISMRMMMLTENMNGFTAAIIVAIIGIVLITVISGLL